MPCVDKARPNCLDRGTLKSSRTDILILLLRFGVDFETWYPAMSERQNQRKSIWISEYLKILHDKRLLCWIIFCVTSRDYLFAFWWFDSLPTLSAARQPWGHKVSESATSELQQTNQSAFADDSYRRWPAMTSMYVLEHSRVFRVLDDTIKEGVP